MLDPACGVATALHYRPFVLVPLAKVMISNGTFIHSLPSHAWHKVMISKAMISWYIHFQATLDTKSWYQKPWYHGTSTSKPRLTQSHDIKNHDIMVHSLPSHAWHKVMISKIMISWYIHFQATCDDTVACDDTVIQLPVMIQSAMIILLPVMILSLVTILSRAHARTHMHTHTRMHLQAHAHTHARAHRLGRTHAHKHARTAESWSNTMVRGTCCSTGLPVSTKDTCAWHRTTGIALYLGLESRQSSTDPISDFIFCQGALCTVPCTDPEESCATKADTHTQN